ncbi:MAG: hypothetical protein K8T26_19445 [Lentisphaerae bacterium]|nr:hypothetical protein [Lentisphaerota bacterium]
MILDSRLLSLLRLGLCPGAADGEWRNAATAFFKSLRKAGVTPDQFTAPVVVTRTVHAAPRREWSRFRFGKYKGQPLNNAPIDYLQWILANCEGLSAYLRAEISACIQCKRGRA